MVMTAIGTMDMALFALEVGFDLGARHRTVADLCLPEQIIDDLVLIQRRAQLGSGHRILLDVLDEPIAILGLILRCGLADQAVHFLLADLDAIGGADFGQQQPEAHAALGDLAIIGGLALDLGECRGGIVFAFGLVAKLRHDILIFGLDHRRRHVEIMAVRELVEQAALHVGPSQAVQFLLLLVAQQALELIEALEPETLGERVIGLGRSGHLDRGGGDGEHGRLTLQIGCRIILGKGHRDVAAFARLDPDETVLETRDELARAKLDRHRFAGAAFERDALDRPDIVKHDLIADRRGMAVRGRRKALLRGHQLLQRFVDHRIVGLGSQPLELDRVDLWLGNLGQRLDADADFGVLAGGVAFVELDLWLHRRADLLLGEQRLHAVLHRGVERIGGERFAVHFADQVGGHLARAEAGHLDLRRHALDFAIDARGDVLCRNGQRVAALEAFIVRFDGLHDAFECPD